MLNTALILASFNGHTEIEKILVKQEGIDINEKDNVYFNNLKFQSNIWNFFKLFKTALIYVSENGYTKIVKVHVEQEGIDINAKNEVVEFRNYFWSKRNKNLKY